MSYLYRGNYRYISLRIMTYNIHLIVESELDEVVCELSTSAGISDLEENVVRKAEMAIKKYESDKEYEAQARYDDWKENGDAPY